MVLDSKIFNVSKIFQFGKQKPEKMKNNFIIIA